MLEIVQSIRVGERVRGGLARVVEEGLLVRQGEGARTALLFSHLLLASAVFTMGRTVRDTLFLSRYPLSALPWMFVLYGFASALTVVVYRRLVHRMPHGRSIVTWCGVGIATYLATWLCVQASVRWIYPAFYVWSDVFSNLAISQFWALANDLHDPRSAKRLFGTIGAARVLGVIVVGLVTGTIVHAIGTEQLLFVLCICLGGIAVLAKKLANDSVLVQAPAPRRRRKPRGEAKLLSDRYVLALSGMLLAGFAALTVGDYQFKAIARATYREDALAQFFSFFYAVSGIISFVFQIVVTPRLLSRFGVGLGMLVMPALFGFSSMLLLGVPTLPVVSVMKFADNGFQYTIHETTLQALYVPFPKELKARARAFLDAVVKPLANGLGGAAVILFAGMLGPIWLGVTSCVFVLFWLACVPLVRARYTQRLTSTLHAGDLGAFAAEPVIDAAGRGALKAALRNNDARLVLAALDELDDSLEPDVRTALVQLSQHEDPAIRVAAVTRLGNHARATPEHDDDDAILRALRDPVPEVRGAAARALAQLREDEAVSELAPLLDDPSEVVRSATLSGLFSFCGFEGAMLGGQRFAELFGSRDPEDREAAARALGGIGRSGTRRLIPLLEDPEPRVRVAAALSAHDVRDARLVPVLIRQLLDRRAHNACVSALSAAGAAAVGPLAQVLGNPEGPRELRLMMPRILRRIPSPESYRRLRESAKDSDSLLRLHVFTALAKLRKRLNAPAEPLDAVRGWVEREIRETLRLVASYEAVRGEVGTALLDDAVEFSHKRGIRRVLRILELRYAPESIRLVKERIDDPAHRANALEVLDTELEPAMRPLIMPFMDDVPAAEKARRYGVALRQSGDELLTARLENANPYSVLVALDAARVHRRPFACDAARKLLNHPNAIVREGALVTLVELDPQTCGAELSRLSQEQDQRVARFARYLLVKRGLLASPEGPMLSTVEKLLILRATPMFGKLRGDDLAPLAHVAEVETYGAGELVFDTGEPGDALFVVIRGKVRITRGSRTLAELGANEVFGEMSVLDEGPRSACARATEDTEVLRIGSEEFSEVLHEQVEIAEGVIRVLSRRLREANLALEHSESEQRAHEKT